MNSGSNDSKWLVAWAHLYCIGVCTWAVLHLLFGDRWWWLFLLNTFAVYLFIPLPLLLVAALLTRRREIWIGLAAILALGAFFYGRLLLPKFPVHAPSGPTLTVMTSNVLGFNHQITPVVAAIQAADADVVALQELNPLVAEAIERDLAVEYPYQVLDPKFGVAGLGVLSRYPLNPIDATLAGQWVGSPQVLDLSFGGRAITLINFHAIPPGNHTPAVLRRSVREREHQARELVAFAAARSGPVIALGDLNAADRSTAYAVLTNSLADAWRTAGWGLGHTFPGAASAGSARPAIAGIPVPMWLVRLDYVFHSDDWQTLAVWIGPWDGISDHRPVAAKLLLQDSTEVGAQRR
jgi:endonuclease/exonuclease/phosphatase (EEP) superfamily protein YafD